MIFRCACFSIAVSINSPSPNRDIFTSEYEKFHVGKIHAIINDVLKNANVEFMVKSELMKVQT